MARAIPATSLTGSSTTRSGRTPPRPGWPSTWARLRPRACSSASCSRARTSTLRARPRATTQSRPRPTRPLAPMGRGCRRRASSATPTAHALTSSIRRSAGSASGSPRPARPAWARSRCGTPPRGLRTRSSFSATRSPSAGTCTATATRRSRTTSTRPGRRTGRCRSAPATSAERSADSCSGSSTRCWRRTRWCGSGASGSAPTTRRTGTPRPRPTSRRTSRRW